MAVTFTLRQITSIQTGPLYRVRNEVTAAVTAEREVFVFSVATQQFSHYATVADMNSYPNTLAQAQADGKTFYRAALVQRDWPTIKLMVDDVNLTVERVQLLASELKAEGGRLSINRTLTLTGA